MSLKEDQRAMARAIRNVRERARQRKAAERERYRESGLVKVEAWIRPEQRERLHAYVARLNRE